MWPGLRLLSSSSVLNFVLEHLDWRQKSLLRTQQWHPSDGTWLLMNPSVTGKEIWDIYKNSTFACAVWNNTNKKSSEDVCVLWALHRNRSENISCSENLDGGHWGWFRERIGFLQTLEILNLFKAMPLPQSLGSATRDFNIWKVKNAKKILFPRNQMVSAFTWEQAD